MIIFRRDPAEPPRWTAYPWARTVTAVTARSLITPTGSRHEGGWPCTWTTPSRLCCWTARLGWSCGSLCAGRRHRNRTGDREEWKARTHKHTFSEQHQATVAYTPNDIPSIPTADVLGEHYRGAFEAFCGEQAIKLTGEYRWVDPVLPGR